MSRHFQYDFPSNLLDAQLFEAFYSLSTFVKAFVPRGETISAPLINSKRIEGSIVR
jgi:hypothetical protein